MMRLLSQNEWHLWENSGVPPIYIIGIEKINSGSKRYPH